MTTNIEIYFAEGCGRCALGGTPDCKVHQWQNELHLLRSIVQDCGLVEESKWGVPCYTLNGKNVVAISALKEAAVLSFFKGVLLKDAQKILESPGENSHYYRLLKFTGTQCIAEKAETIKAYILEAKANEAQGKEVPKRTESEPIPEELEAVFEEMPELETAFFKLTKGRQRGYLLHFAQPKQSKTRTARIEKWMPSILQGKGMHDDYRKL